MSGILKLRRDLRARYGPTNYQITKEGLIRVRGAGVPWHSIGSVGEDGNIILSGRPADMEGGRKVAVYLDEQSTRRASIMGDGNISLGIRRALEIAAI
jgi:hypothetical protein